jgi:hypothetical protein
VVENRVEHQPKIAAQPFDLLPAAQRRVNRVIIANRKAVIRGGRVKRQDVDAADHTL